MNKFDELMRQHHQLAADFQHLKCTFEEKCIEIKKQTQLAKRAIQLARKAETPFLEIIPGLLFSARTLHTKKPKY